MHYYKYYWETSRCTKIFSGNEELIVWQYFRLNECIRCTAVAAYDVVTISMVITSQLAPYLVHVSLYTMANLHVSTHKSWLLPLFIYVSLAEYLRHIENQNFWTTLGFSHQSTKSFNQSCGKIIKLKPELRWVNVMDLCKNQRNNSHCCNQRRQYFRGVYKNVRATDVWKLKTLEIRQKSNL